MSAFLMLRQCSIKNALRTPFHLRFTSDARNVLIEVNNDQLRKQKNQVEFGGKTVENFKSNQVKIRNGPLTVMATPLPSIRHRFEEVVKDMNIIVRGQLIQKAEVAERDGRFFYERIHYISAENIEIVNPKVGKERTDSEESTARQQEERVEDAY